MMTYSNILKYIDSTTYMKPHKELICQCIDKITITKNYGQPFLISKSIVNPVKTIETNM